MFLQPLGGSSYAVNMTIRVKKIIKYYSINVHKFCFKIRFVKKRLYLKIFIAVYNLNCLKTKNQ
jgi:hypothetical protein